MSHQSSAFSNHEIEAFLNGKAINAHNCVIPIEFLTTRDYNLDLIFNDRFFTVLFLGGDLDIGHFTLLSHLTGSDGKDFLEYFDSTGGPLPDLVLELAKRNNLLVMYSNEKLQEYDTFTCAKWCISRILSLPIPLSMFVDIFKSNKKYKPDEIVDALYILKKY